MHNFDRTTLESGYNEFESDEYGYEFEVDHENYGESYGEGPFSEAEEMEWASEFLSITNEAELDHFIGELVQKKGGRGKFGKFLGGFLKGAAKKILPMVGNLIAPGIGGVIGQGVAGLLGRKRRGGMGGQQSGQDQSVMNAQDQTAMDDQSISDAEYIFGMELEGLSQEDQEFEIARQFVRFAGAAAENAAEMASTMPPAKAAQQATVAAAQQHAPGFLVQKPQPAARISTNVVTQKPVPILPGASPGKPQCNHPMKGTWERRYNSRYGHFIILRGV